MNMTTAQINKKIAENEKSFLSFKLADEFFAINVMKIMEILEVPKITKVPQTPDFLKGVINLRGAVLPIIDSRIKFKMAPIEFTINTCILVLNIQVDNESIMVGALVDSVLEVFEIEDSQIQASPTIGTQYRADFIQGMIKEKDQFMMLLDIDKVFSSNDLEEILEIKDESKIKQIAE
jgi:purine-binding chemotaxis protein CheW